MVFKKKLSRELPLNFWDKTIGYRNIQVYGVKQDSVDFLNPEKYFHYNKNKKKGFGSILWKIILILFFLLGIYLIIKGEWRQPT